MTFFLSLEKEENLTSAWLQAVLHRASPRAYPPRVRLSSGLESASAIFTRLENNGAIRLVCASKLSLAKQRLRFRFEIELNVCCATSKRCFHHFFEPHSLSFRPVFLLSSISRTVASLPRPILKWWYHPQNIPRRSNTSWAAETQDRTRYQRMLLRRWSRYRMICCPAKLLKNCMPRYSEPIYLQLLDKVCVRIESSRVGDHHNSWREGKEILYGCSTYLSSGSFRGSCSSHPFLEVDPKSYWEHWLMRAPSGKWSPSL